MCDKLVFDLSQEIEGSPNVFIRKDWINILDNQNQNYNNNQSVVDTSQLSNSNKYMSYRESYFSIPLTMTLQSTASAVSAAITQPFFSPQTKSADYAVGLKNWFGQIIHSFTLDYNGTTICQQTPYINMWNSFKLATSLSLDDINTQGATIGFYPDDATSFQFVPAVAGAPASKPFLCGQGVCNNTNTIVPQTAGVTTLNTFDSGLGNNGFLRRQQLINFDTGGLVGPAATDGYGTLIDSGAFNATGFSAGLNDLWKSYIYNKVNGAAATAGTVQTAIVATVYLKHVHSFFNMCPLLKGVFMKMTLNLNNTSTQFYTTSTVAAVANSLYVPEAIVCTGVQNAIGGVNPLMIASAGYPAYTTPAAAVGAVYAPPLVNGGFGLFTNTISTLAAGGTVRWTFRTNLSVGARVLDAGMVTAQIVEAPLSKSVYLYIPAYTFNPTFEQAFLSSPVKQIKYTDVYQYQVLNIPANNQFNNLLTNGIANVKSVLILPFYASGSGSQVTNTIDTIITHLNSNTGFLQGTPVFQSPFDPAGTGPTSPLCHLSNFNVQVSGQNAIYNTQKYNFEQFNNQLYGQNAVNGGCTDGLTSGLIDRQKFDMEYSYYYVNVERMLPVEASVPKSIQIIGTNKSAKAVDLYCFIEYGSEISIDCLTGARV